MLFRESELYTEYYRISTRRREDSSNFLAARADPLSRANERRASGELARSSVENAPFFFLFSFHSGDHNAAFLVIALPFLFFRALTS